VAEKHSLMKYMKFKHAVTGAYWDSERGIWEVHVQGPDGVEFTDTCNVLVNGGGILK
jgi:cation diffusion facilitator CzcD-associated flavoprotein CzcO